MNGTEERPAHEVSELILQEILQALDEGRELDRTILKRRYPGHEDAIERLCAATASYRAALPLAFDGHEPSNLPPGTQLGDFVIESFLGRGGMAEVYRARQQSLGSRMVAIKVFRQAAMNDREKERFEQEALLSSSLHHPNLAEVHGFGTAQGLLYYAMRLVDGPTLQAVLELLAHNREGAQAQSERTHIVERIAEVASALVVVHRAGLVHRDIKPANIMLDGNSGDSLVPNHPAVLVDFGLIHRVNSQTEGNATATPGTMSYAAPEQLLGEEVDPRADVFSLGVTLHDLLAARLPADRMQASAGLEPLSDLIPSIDPDLSAIVSKATDPLPKWRYRDAGELHTDLTAYLAGEPVCARSLALPVRAVRWIWRHPRPAIRAIAAILTISLLTLGTVQGISILGQIRTLNSAEQAGDVQTLCATLYDLPSLLARPPLLQPALATLARAMQAKDPSNAVVGVYHLLQSQQSEEALYAAAVCIATEGIEQQPLLTRFLLRPLDGTQTDQLRSHALLLIARLFLEHPNRNSQERIASAAFRDQLASLLDSRLPKMDQLHLIAALSGCGTPEIIPHLWSWLTSQNPAGEEQRLGLQAIEWILRRSQACEAVRTISTGELSKLMNEMASALEGVSDTDDPQWQALQVTWFECLKALAFFCRVRSEPVRYPDGLEQLFGEQLTRNLLAASQDSALLARVPARLVSPTADRGELEGELKPWAWRSGAFGSDALTRKVKELCEESAGSLWIDAQQQLFETWYDKGIEEVAGIICDQDQVDEQSHLEYCAQDQNVQAISDLQKDRSPVQHPIVAEWDFGTLPGVVRGEAIGAQVLHARESNPADSYRYIALVPRISSVELNFTIEQRPAADAWVLTLRHQATKRRYFPYQGLVYLDIALDGVPIHAGYSVPNFSMHDDLITLPATMLEQGSHTLSIRVAKIATTMYRLQKATLTSG